MFRVAACGGSTELPAGFDRKIVDRHCAEMQRRYASYKKAWADKAGPFIANLRPATLPSTVVYPFGGGDLTSALVVFPDATAITTISLEASGDVRAIDRIPPRTLAADLSGIGRDINRLFRAAHSTTESLQDASHSTLPGTIMFALAALAVHGYEPRGLRYFAIEPDGSLRYQTAEELDTLAAAFAAKTEQRDRHFWTQQLSPYANIEISYARPGDATARTYRHIVANLDDDHMAADRRVLAHLETLGTVSTMTKAASFLLWYDEFSQIRAYLLKHMAWMISDASGIPPSHAGPAGFVQETYGSFLGPYFNKDTKNVKAEFIRMWKQQPKRPLPFRFGYPDYTKTGGHLMVTRRP